MHMSLGELRELVMDGRPGMLHFMVSQRVGHDWATELNWTEVFSTAPNTQRDSKLSREEKGEGGNRGYLVEKRESKWGERNQASNHTPKWKGVLKIRVLKVKSENEVVQSCPNLCDPMDCSVLGSSIHGIFQARILEWVAISFARRSFQPRDWTLVSCIVGRRFTVWATREVNW